MKDELNKRIQRAEGLLCGLVLKNLETLNDYNINKKILGADALFYIGIADRLTSKGVTVVDEVAFAGEVESVGLYDKYEEMGGFSTVKELISIVDLKNADSIFDEWTKWNLVKRYNEKGILDIDIHWDKINKMNSQQIIDYIEYQISDIDIDVCTDIDFENLSLTDEDIDVILSGANMGISFAKHSPLLNYLTMGLPKGDLTMFASYTNGGKSSYTMNNIIIPIAEQKIKCCIVANEQKSIVYKLLLQTYVLTEKLNYWKLTRKKLKSGKWTDEDKEMVSKARQIIKEQYEPYITFVKVYDYDMGKIKKIAKKLSKVGLELLLYDTMKYSGADENTWLSLLQDSKDLFQICSKLNIAGVVTFQLLIGLKNKLRIVDAEALTNGKQVAEVFSEMIGFRDIWEDEFKDEPCDIKPYRFKRDSEGKYTNIKEYIELDKDKKYKIFFHFKTRSDEVGSAILYEFKGHQNKWIEIGYCTPHQKNRY